MSMKPLIELIIVFAIACCLAFAATQGIQALHLSAGMTAQP